MRNSNFLVLMLAVVLCSYSMPVRADLITIAITGQVASVDDQFNHFGGQINVGDTITGTYTFDSTTIDEDSNPSTGVYNTYAAPAGISISIGNFDFGTDPTRVYFEFTVANGLYALASYYNSPLPDGTPVQHLFWNLSDSTGTALSSDTLPITAPDLTKWDDNTLIIGRDRDFGISATVTSAVLVPEPCSILLLLAGFALSRRTNVRREDEK